MNPIRLPSRLVGVLLAATASFAWAEAPAAFRFESQNLSMSMHYLDVAPVAPSNGRTAILLHGKNFCASAWAGTVETLRTHGWRVVVPEQVGFCASDKPASYQFSFHQLASNTRALIDTLAIDKVDVVAHSMGGMLAIRFALMYPQRVGRLVLVNPLGLEDWKAKGVPYRSVDEAFVTEQRSTFDSIEKYQRASYYAGEWKPAYAALARELAAQYTGANGKAYAWNAALTGDMIYTQPVVHELDQLRVPTTLIIGQRDRTAIGRDLAPKEVQAALGDYPALGKLAAKRIPNATLVEMPGLGHLPQIEAPEPFAEKLLEALH